MAPYCLAIEIVSFKLIDFNFILILCNVIASKRSFFNKIDSNRPTTKIDFLKKEILIPDGVNDAVVSEIQKLLGYYENPLLKLRQELTNCDEHSDQNGSCSELYKKFKV